MEVLPFVRLLWRRRLLVAAGLLVTIVLMVVGGPPPAATTAVAWTSVALDTPTSQLVEDAPHGADSLPWRAGLLAHLMETDEAQRELAGRLKVRPDLVQVADPTLDTPEIAASLPQKASDVASLSVAPYVLTVQIPNTSLPVIGIEAAAPDRAGAAQLAEAAVAVLESHASSEGSYASAIPTGGRRKLQPFLIQKMANVHVKTLVKRKLPIKTVGIPVILFVVWVGCLTFIRSRPQRRSRHVAQSA